MKYDNMKIRSYIMATHPNFPDILESDTLGGEIARALYKQIEMYETFHKDYKSKRVSKARRESGVGLGYSNLPQNIQEAIVEMYLSGRSITSIRKEIGITQNSVTLCLARYGLRNEFDINSKKITPHKKEQIFKLYRDGHSVQQIQKIAGVSYPTVSTYLLLNPIVRKELNLPTAPTQKLSPKKRRHTDAKEVAAFKKMYANGTSVTAIARHYKRGINTVRRKLGLR